MKSELNASNFVVARDGECSRDALWTSSWSRTDKYVRNILTKIMDHHWNYCCAFNTNLHLHFPNTETSASRQTHLRTCRKVRVVGGSAIICICFKFPYPKVPPISEYSVGYDNTVHGCLRNTCFVELGCANEVFFARPVWCCNGCKFLLVSPHFGSVNLYYVRFLPGCLDWILDVGFQVIEGFHQTYTCFSINVMVNHYCFNYFKAYLNLL